MIDKMKLACRNLTVYQIFLRIAAISVVLGFALVGAIDTVEIWSPVAIVGTIAVGAVHSIYRARKKKLRYERAKRWNLFAADVSQFMFWALNYTHDFPISFQEVYSASMIRGVSERIITADQEPVYLVRVTLYASKAELDVTGENLYLTYKFLQYLADKYCEDNQTQINEKAGIAITNVCCTRSVISLDFVKPETPAELAYIRKAAPDTPNWRDPWQQAYQQQVEQHEALTDVTEGYIPTPTTPPQLEDRNPYIGRSLRDDDII